MVLKKQHKDRYHFGAEEQHEPIRWRTLLVATALFLLICIVAARAK